MGGIKMGGGFSPARKNLKLVVFTWNPGACADAKFPKPRNANAVIATMLNVFIAVSFWFVSWRKNAARPRDRPRRSRRCAVRAHSNGCGRLAANLCRRRLGDLTPPIRWQAVMPVGDRRNGSRHR